MPRLTVLALLLALLALAFGQGTGSADEPPGSPAPGRPAPGDKPADGRDAKPNDEADDKVTFVEEVNRAIDQGVAWLKAKPEIFPFEDGEAAHWGLIHGERKYDPNSEGIEYRHPAGCTALALYTLLKCGADPKDPLIDKGFRWLRLEHEITPAHDGWPNDGGWRWTHTQAGGSYEISAMILALTARYDAWKRNKNSADAARKGKLKMEKEDLEWLNELVTGLVERRGKPKDAAEVPQPERMGWRYNAPTLEFHRSTGGGRTGRTLNETFRRGGWITPPANQDLSSTQLAALALYSAQRFGVRVEPGVWFDIVNYSLDHQEPNGPDHKRHDPAYSSGGYATPTDKARGFMYVKGATDLSHGKATGSMTACGLTNLVLARDVLTSDEKTKALWMESKLDKKVETAIWDALAWLDKYWSAFDNRNSQVGYHVYYLYALERAMDMLGKNLVGKHLWYTEGAQSLLARQNRVKVKASQKKNADEVDGVFWNVGASHDPKDVLDTCFALLFLKRATKGLVPTPAVTGGPGAPAENR